MTPARAVLVAAGRKRSHVLSGADVPLSPVTLNNRALYRVACNGARYFVEGLSVMVRGEAPWDGGMIRG